MKEPAAATVFVLEIAWAFVVQGGLIGLIILFMEKWPHLGYWGWLAVVAWVLLATCLRAYARKHPVL